jgi:hypothetical protein
VSCVCHVCVMCTAVPQNWTQTDRLNYIKLGEKRKTEHAQYYAVVSIGCQMFANALSMRDSVDIKSSEDSN